MLVKMIDHKHVAVFLALLSLLTGYVRNQNALSKHCGKFPVEFKDVNNATYVIGGMFPVHYYNSSEHQYLYNKPGLMWVEAMLFALEEINNSTDILPGIKLGYKMFDSCNTINTAIEAALQLTQGFQQYNNATCQCNTTGKRAIGLVGDAASATTTRVASILSASQTTQISYSATSTDLSTKYLYPSFLRTIPPDNIQALLVTDLMIRFKWKYVNVIACDDNYGRVGVSELLPQLKRFNICTAISEVYDVKNDENNKMTNIVIQKLQNEKEATVIVLWCQRPEAIKVLQAAEELKLYHRTWIATEAYGRSSDLYKINHNVVKGLFGIIPAQSTYHSFIERLKSITPNNSDNNPWLDEYWTSEKNCTIINDKKMLKYKCPNNDVNLSLLPPNKYVNVIDSVYAIAHGLHNYMADNKNTSNFVFSPSTLLQYVKNVSFKGKSGNVSFNHFGNPVEAKYSLTNLQYDVLTDKLQYRVVGIWKFAVRNIAFNNKNLQFSNDSVIVPLSSCAELCHPGHKGLTFGDRPCCWKCVKCPPGEVQPDYGKSFCSLCNGEKLPNKNQTVCIEPSIQYLQVSSTVGILLVSFTVLAYTLIIASMVVFWINRKTPVVRASNKHLSLLQLISMLCMYALPALCIATKPTVTLCTVQLYYFVACYTISVSVTFTKADRLLRIFKASKCGILAKRSRVKSNNVQLITVGILTFVALALCTVLYLPFRPKIEKKVFYRNEDVQALYYCSGYYDSILFILIGYVTMIALICGVYAFKARKLPETYNEARYTSFAMFTFLLAWMMFIPIYFSTASKLDRVATWCFVSFVSTLAIFCFMYLPKVHIILFKPEENTAEKFREKMKTEALENNTSYSASSSGIKNTMLDAQYKYEIK